MFVYTLLLILALRRAPPALQDRHGLYTLPEKPRESQIKAVGHYHHLRGFRWGGLILAISSVPVCLVVLVVGVGVLQVNKGEQELEAEFGSAGYM